VVDVARRLMLLSLACCCSVSPGGRIFAAADTDPNDGELETPAFTVLLLPCEFVCLSGRSAFLLDVFGLGECEICGLFFVLRSGRLVSESGSLRNCSTLRPNLALSLREIRNSLVIVKDYF